MSAASVANAIERREDAEITIGHEKAPIDGARCFCRTQKHGGPMMVPLGCCGYLKEAGLGWQRGSGRRVSEKEMGEAVTSVRRRLAEVAGVD